MAEKKARHRRKKNLLLQWAELGLFRLIQGILRVLPREFIRALGRVIGRLLFRLARSRTRLALTNLERSIPEMSEEDRVRTIRSCWERFSVETLRYVRTIGSPAEILAQESEIHYEERLRSAIALGKGLVVYTAHFGAWESAIALIKDFGLSFAVVARPLDNERLETLLTKSRERFDVEMVPKRNAARVLMRRLSKGQGVLVLPDQAVHPREGVLVPFLGRPAWTTAAPARLALRYGAPIVGAFCYRRGEAVVAEITEPLFTHEMDQSDESAEVLTTRINDEISNRIRRDPELWLWMHDRWKRSEPSSR